jgi:two-component system NtrC family sensor kinase
MRKRESSSRERYYNIRRTIIVFGILMIVLLVSALVLGIFSAKRMKDIVRDDFNKQQLILARYAANQIEDNLNCIKRELSLLSLSPSIQYMEVSWPNRMNNTLTRVKEVGVIEIRFLDMKGEKAYIVDKLGVSRIIQGKFQDTEYFQWALQKSNRNRIYVGEVTGESEQYPERLVMTLAIPSYQESIDELHLVPKGHMAGVLVFTVDVAYLVGKVIKDIKSGKTGYAWAIDSKGIFLYHPEGEFIGKDAFKARATRKPKISFDEINLIQKEKMLQGEEGTGWYTSGWHRDIENETKKLIAYYPVYVASGQDRNWSVAVVAPISEVEGTVHSVYLRQFYIQGVIVLVIVFGSIYVISFERHWAKILEEEVTKKTEYLTKTLDKLEKSEEKYRTLVESAEDLIFAVDEEGKYLSMNRCATRFFRGEPEDLIGKNIYDLFSKESAELQMGFIRQVFNTGKNVNVKHPVQVGKREYWFTSNFVGIKNESGKVFNVLGISRDITERKKMEDEQMYNTEKLAALGKLSASVAHELNNPTAIILGFTDLLLENAEPGSKNHEMLETVEKQALNCKRILESLLGFARYREKTEYATDANGDIEKVLAVVENMMATKNIKLKRNLAKDLPKVRGDSGHLQQVFMNLITNAIATMEGGGALTISTRLVEPGNRVEILFKDTGHGIKKEYREKIFDAFFTTKRVGEGTGLGLSVCYGIVTKYGGEISFETISEEEDREKKGTTFTVSLPIVPSGSEDISAQT